MKLGSYNYDLNDINILLKNLNYFQYIDLEKGKGKFIIGIKPDKLDKKNIILQIIEINFE